MNKGGMLIQPPQVGRFKLFQSSARRHVNAGRHIHLDDQPESPHHVGKHRRGEE